MNLDETTPTRMIFMGSSSLADGFRLVGFEIWADPDLAQMESVLQAIRNNGEKAFVVLERELAESNSAILKRLQSEGGRVIITQIPPLHDTSRFHQRFDQQVEAMMGSSGLTPQVDDTAHRNQRSEERGSGH